MAPLSAPSLIVGGVWVGVWDELALDDVVAPSPGTSGVWEELAAEVEVAPSPGTKGVRDELAVDVDEAPSPSIDGVWGGLIVQRALLSLPSAT
jgi:hypothetical protein